MKYILIAFGGAIGALLRVVISESLYKVSFFSIPLGIISVNIIGCFLVGIFYDSLSDKFHVFIVLGFLGAFTTFSAFSRETLELLNKGEIVLAFLYVLISVLLCLLSTWIGILARSGT